MNPLKRIITGLGAQTAPFGFSPDDPNAAYRAGWGVIGDMSANLMANNQPGVDILSNLGASLQQAKAGAADRNRQDFAARQMMEQAAENRRKREDEAARQKQMEDAIAQLPADQQALARMVPEKFFGAQVDSMFGQPDTPALVQEYLTAKQEGFPGTLADWKTLGGGSGGADLGLTPVPLADENGNFVGWGQLSKGGGIYPAQLQGGDGMVPMSPFERKRSESSGAAQGSAEGEAIAGAGGDIAAADLALGKINELREDPNRSWGTGASSIFNVIPATPGYDFQTKVDEVTAGAFLTAIQQMRGLGQLSNVEGQTAKQAVTRMKTATSESEFLDALNDYEEIVMAGKQLAQKRLQSAPNARPSGEEPRTRYKFNADTGELE